MAGTQPMLLACAARNGGIVIAEACPPGLVPFARDNNRRRLEIAICRASRRVRGNQVVVPGLSVEISDELANLTLQEFRVAVHEQFVEARMREKFCGTAAA